MSEHVKTGLTRTGRRKPASVLRRNAQEDLSAAGADRAAAQPPSDGGADQQPPAGPGAGGAVRRVSNPGILLVRRLGLVIFGLAMIALFSGLSPNAFFTHGTLISVITAEAVPMMLALAVTITLRLHDLDVSFAAIMILTAAVFAELLVADHVNLAVAIIAALAIGLLAGLVNGFMVVVLKLSSFIATLGTMSVAEGVALSISHSTILTGLPAALTTTMQNGPGGVPLGAIIGWALLIVLWLVFEYTPFGRYLLFIGGNRTAAELLGLPVRRVRITAYALTGVLYASTGIVLAGMLGSVDPTSDATFLLSPLAAAFLGTTVFQLGRFNAWGTAVSIYVLAAISTGLQILGASAWVGDVFEGGALIVAIALSRILGKNSVVDLAL
jgi:ribose transport system permease protein